MQFFSRSGHIHIILSEDENSKDINECLLETISFISQLYLTPKIFIRRPKAYVTQGETSGNNLLECNVIY